MLIEIVRHTPPWVWLLLAVLIARGLALARTRERRMGTLYIIPLVLLCIGLQAIAARFGAMPLAWGAWACGFAVGGALGWISIPDSAVALSPNGIRLAGSYWPLVLILGVFCVRYASEVLRAIHPELMVEPGAIAAVCIASALVSGLFVGRVARIGTRYAALRRQAPIAVAN